MTNATLENQSLRGRVKASARASLSLSVQEKRIFTTSASLYVRVPVAFDRVDLSQHQLVHQNRIRPCHVSGTQRDDVFWRIVRVVRAREMHK